MKVLHVDTNHPILISELEQMGMQCDEDYKSPKTEIEKKIGAYDGLVIRSRFSIDQSFLDAATKLKFIARVGAGLENIDLDYASKKNIQTFAAPEGNCTAVGEQALGMLLSLFNNLNRAHSEVQNGIWKREENRGVELSGKTVGIIGFGHMGQSFAQKLAGFNCKIIYYDIEKKPAVSYAKQVHLDELFKKTEVLSIHTPDNKLSRGMINKNFIDLFEKPFYLINTARGNAVHTADLVTALQNKQILGACLDVLEYEKKSFESLFSEDTNMPEAFAYLTQSKRVLLSPHIAGWTHESKKNGRNFNSKNCRIFQ